MSEKQFGFCKMLSTLKRMLAIACLLATAFFVILWMRSLRQLDYIGYEVPGRSYTLSSCDGLAEFYDGVPWHPANNTARGFFIDSIKRPNRFKVEPSVRPPQFDPHDMSLIVDAPFWLLISINLVFAAVVLMRRSFRFSLRTLAIAATLIVLTLGLGVAASRLTLG